MITCSCIQRNQPINLQNVSLFHFSRELPFSTSTISPIKTRTMMLIQSKGFTLPLFAWMIMMIPGVSARLGFLSRYLDRTCKTLVATLPVEPECGCSGGYSLALGLNFNINCTLSEPLCIDPPDNQFCGTPSFSGQYSRRGTPSTTTLAFDAEGLFGSDVLDPPAVTFVLTHARPVDLTNPIQFESCDASADGTACTSCDICENGQSFKFDCSNIQYGGIIKTSLPNVEECIGLNDNPVQAPASAPVPAPAQAQAPV